LFLAWQEKTNERKREVMNINKQTKTERKKTREQKKQQQQKERQ
jgi:hypothetical protein